ncbi:MAG: GDSL-type esterase/lipase family protein [Acidimicrobiales bacterium]
MLTWTVVPWTGVAVRAAADGPGRPGRANWVAGWAAAPTGATALGLVDATSRMAVTVDAPGSAVRVHLSNASVPGATTIGPVSIGAAGRGAAVIGPSRAVRFGGSPTVTLPAGAGRWSDPVPMAVRAGERLTVSVYAPDAPEVTELDDSTEATAWTSRGDLVSDTTGRQFVAAVPGVAPWRVVDGIAVAAPRRWSTLVAFGDSITAGYQYHQTPGHPTWPMLLARRLTGGGARSCPVSVVNEAISANLFTRGSVPGFSGGPSGLSRFEGDALAQPGVREVIILLGTNDIAWDTTHGVTDPVGRLERAYRAVVAEAHARRVRVVAATLTPAGDPSHPTLFLGGYSTAAAVADRAEFNRWLSRWRAVDGVVDFDRAVRSESDPHLLAAWADSGDHLHPSTRGYAAMVGAIGRPQITGCPTGRSALTVRAAG